MVATSVEALGTLDKSKTQITSSLPNLIPMNPRCRQTVLKFQLGIDLAKCDYKTYEWTVTFVSYCTSQI